MKAFKTFLFENNNITRLHLKKGKFVFEFIMENCQQWFTELDAPKFKNNTEFIEWLMKNKYSLYRSVGNLSRGTYINKSIDFRIPKDTPPIVQNLFDDALKRSGFTTLRQNSLFCTNSIQQAFNYSRGISSPFLVFPIDGYQYLFSEKIYDLYDLLKYQSIQNYFNIFENKEEINKYYVEFSEKETNRSLINFIKYLIDSMMSQVDILNLLKIDVEEFNNTFKFTNRGIKQYVLHDPPKEFEIMIRPSIILTHYKELESTK